MPVAPALRRRIYRHDSGALTSMTKVGRIELNVSNDPPARHYHVVAMSVELGTQRRMGRRNDRGTTKATGTTRLRSIERSRLPDYTSKLAKYLIASTSSRSRTVISS
jgi:hypothetical protein